MKPYHSLCLSLLSIGFALPGLAQSELEASSDLAIFGAHNQLGVLTYCETQGFIDDLAIQIQNKVIEMLPEAENLEDAEKAFETGLSGHIQAHGLDMMIDEAAEIRGGDARGYCREVSRLLVQAGASLLEPQRIAEN